MRNFLIAASLLVLSSAATAGDVRVSVSVGQPGFYGRIDLNNHAHPDVIYRDPIVVRRSSRYVDRSPIYLRVPPGHARRWERYCDNYQACGQPVYFVEDSWYFDEYAPRHYKKRDYDRRSRYDSYYDRDHSRHDRGNRKGHYDR